MPHDMYILDGESSTLKDVYSSPHSISVGRSPSSMGRWDDTNKLWLITKIKKNSEFHIVRYYFHVEEAKVYRKRGDIVTLCWTTC